MAVKRQNMSVKLEKIAINMTKKGDNIFRIDIAMYLFYTVLGCLFVRNIVRICIMSAILKFGC